MDDPKNKATPDNIISWRWSTKPRIVSDDPEHADEIREDPASFAQDLIMDLMLDRQSQGLPLGEYEHMKVEDIESIVLKGGEVTITLLPPGKR